MTGTEAKEGAQALCWWCGQRPGNSGEHRFKRSDLVREHGRGELTAERQLVYVGRERTRALRSTKSKPLKFGQTLCGHCNATRSQPFDRAYDRFMDWVLEHEEEVLAERRIDLIGAFGPTWRAQSLDVLRYWTKHIGCRLVENYPEGTPNVIPPELIDFLDGGPLPNGYSFELWIEPSRLRLAERGATDRLWKRILSFDAMWITPDPEKGHAHSTWRYSWFTLGWAFGGPTETFNPFENAYAPIPYRALEPAMIEWSFAQVSAGAYGERVDNTARLTRLTGGDPIDPDQTLDESPIAEAFIGGLLDFEAGVYGRVPDRRDPPRQEVQLDVEVWRAWLVVTAALEIWAPGKFAMEAVLNLPEPDDSARILRSSAVLEEQAELSESFSAIAAALARMAALRLLEGLDRGTDPERSVDASAGQELLRESASLAGASAAAAGLDVGGLGELFDSVDALLVRLARVN